MAEYGIMPEIDNDRLYAAIENGVKRAMWQMITNCTQMPCQDFYTTIQDAAEKAFSGLSDNIADRVSDSLIESFGGKQPDEDFRKAVEGLRRVHGGMEKSE